MGAVSEILRDGVPVMLLARGSGDPKISLLPGLAHDFHSFPETSPVP